MLLRNRSVSACLPYATATGDERLPSGYKTHTFTKWIVITYYYYLLLLQW